MVKKRIKLNRKFDIYYSPKQMITSVEKAFKNLKKYNRSNKQLAKNVLIQRRTALQIKALSINKKLKELKKGSLRDSLINQNNYLFSEISAINKFRLKEIAEQNLTKKDIKFLKSLYEVNIKEGKKGYFVYTDYQKFKNEIIKAFASEGIDRYDVKEMQKVLGGHTIKQLYKKWLEKSSKLNKNEEGYKIINLVGGIEKFTTLLFDRRKTSLKKALKQIESEDAKSIDLLDSLGI